MSFRFVIARFEMECDVNSKNPCPQAKVITLKEKTKILLVLVTESNVQIHDLVDNAILYVYTIEETEFSTIREISPENFANGIAFLDKTQSILVGLVNGSLLSLNTGDIEGNGIVSSIEMTQNVEAVMDIATSESLIAVGYSSGKTCVLEVKRKRSPSIAIIGFSPSPSSSTTYDCMSPFYFSLLVQFESFNGFPCTNVCLCPESILISSYGSGHIRIFSLTQRRLLSEVYAHKSWINSLHLVPKFRTRKSLDQGKGKFDYDGNEDKIVPPRKEEHIGGGKNDVEQEEEEEEVGDGRSDLERRSQLLLSASDDSFVRVWKVNQYYPWIQLEWSTSVKNKLLVGACFLNNSPSTIAVSCYDSNQVFLYGRKYGK